VNTRERILEEVRVHPGIHKSLLHRSVGGAWGTVLHHVRVLEREGEIRTVHDGWRTHLYLASEGDMSKYLAWLKHLRPTPPASSKKKSGADEKQSLQMVRGPQRNGDETRAAILRAVEATPGLNKSQASQSLGISWGCLRYHVQVLERSFQLRVHRSRGEVHLFPLNLPKRHVQWLSVLRDDTRLELAQLIAEYPGTDSANLADLVGVSPRSIQRHLVHLRGAELVEAHVNRTTPEALAFLRRFLPLDSAPLYTSGEPGDANWPKLVLTSAPSPRFDA
jgi:predicted transcriptional regulator